MSAAPKRQQRPASDPFFLNGSRAMVSLGPLSERKYCSYSCPFCYVHAGFVSYASLPPREIITWLTGQAGRFDIIYISGDTDSFAPPRTAEGLDLLDACAGLGVDVLFTTRYAFSEEELTRVAAIAARLARQGRLLFGCTSISQLHHPHLEPKPIPAPELRFEQLRRFRELGVQSVLAMRPFLPTVPTADYMEIVERAAPHVHVILGEAWYADVGGRLERAVTRNQALDQEIFGKHRMDFDGNGLEWKVYEAKPVVRTVEDRCHALGVPFFMRSAPAIELLRQRARETAK